MLAATAVLAAAITLPNCEWRYPGHDPYMSDVLAAVDDYKTIPEPIREKLKARMMRHRYDDLVTISRNKISGKGDYDSDLRGMHFGARGQLCATVTRKSWSKYMRERALVYCEAGDGEDYYCIAVPTVCRNVSLITRYRAPPPFVGLPPLPPESPPDAPPQAPPVAAVPPTEATPPGRVAPPWYESPPSLWPPYVFLLPAPRAAPAVPTPRPVPPDDQTHEVPEPSTLALLLTSGIIGYLVNKLKGARRGASGRHGRTTRGRNTNRYQAS